MSKALADKYGLSEKQRKFADEFIKTGNASASYCKFYDIEPGGKKASSAASRALKRASISGYIQEKMQAKDKEQVAQEDEILGFLTAVMRGEVKDTIPLGLGMGAQKLTQRKVQTQDRVRAAEMLGRRHRLWTETNLEVQASVVIVDDLPDTVPEGTVLPSAEDHPE